MLTEEKKKWDASIMATAKIGLLFCEEGLQKPATEEKFLSEYKSHLDKFPALHDTTLKRIYKNLPDGYRFSRSGGNIASEQADLTPIIKAAAFAGSMAYDRASMNKTSLKKSMSLEQYVIPSDDLLVKIIDAVKRLELDTND